MRIDGDMVKFRSGREEYANLGIVGLSPDGNASGGYNDAFAGYADGELTKAERAELAAYMIQEWAAFAVKEVKE
jgi:hypothetical protein